MINEIQKAKEAAAAFEQLKRVSNSLGDIGHIANKMAEIQKLIAPHATTLANFRSQVENSMAALRPITSCIDMTSKFQNLSVLSGLSSMPKAFELLQANNMRWRNLALSVDSLSARLRVPDQAIARFSSSALVWDSGISATLRRVSELGPLTQQPLLFSRLLAPSNALSSFAERTYSLMKDVTDGRVLRALDASLMLANTQHFANIAAFTAIRLDHMDNAVVSSPRNLATPFVQQEELLALPEFDDDESIELIVSQSPAAQASEVARAVLTLTTTCNKASNVKGLKEIFKPTTRVMEVFADFPWLTPQNEKAFGEFIDCLYFLAYEGAGDDKLRFLQKHGGPLSDADCQVIWCIKALRNKWLRHDPDHGKDTDIEKSRKLLSTNFQWLGLPGYPRSSSDFRKLHERLLKEMEEFLSKLLKAI